MAIYYEHIMTVNGAKASLDKEIYLYKGNRNIDYYFTIKDARFRYSKNENGNIVEKMSPSHAQVSVLKPDGSVVTSGIAQIKDDKVKLTVTADMIDEDTEVGQHTLVIDLMDSENDSLVTLPPLIDQVFILERITPLPDDSALNIVNSAVVNLANTTESQEEVVIIDEEGNYVKTEWLTGDRITTERLNKIEEGIFKNNSAIKDIANKFTHEQTSNSYKIKYGDTVIANIPLGNIEVTSYAITNNLTYCSNDNSATEIIEGNSYIANINANSGYELSSVSVSMGGVDITNSCYGNGVISIVSVTGDIIINAIANLIITPSTEPVLTWNYNNNVAGNGYGAITMSVGATEDEGSYDIKYADNTGELTNYDKICTLNPTVDNPSSYSYFNKEQLIPKYATKLIALRDNTVKAEFTIPTNKRFNAGNYGQHLYSFGAISDVHLSVDTAESDFATALTYLNSNENVAFTCISGDLTNNGTEEQFTTYKNLVATNSANTPVYATNGNHENRNSSFSDELWNTYVNNPLDYVFTHGNDVFIFLALRGINEYVAPFTAEQQSWIEGLLEKYKNCRVFLFLHPFINGTGNGNYNDLYTVIYFTKTNTYGKWLLDLMKQYKNVFLFTGHSHLKFITQELDSRVTICNNVDDVETGYLVHIPSITIPRDIVDSSSISDYLYAQSEGVVVDVYENCILYRGRNFVDEKFIPIGQFILQKSQGTLPTVNTYTVSNNLTNCSNSNVATTINEDSSYIATITANSGYTLSSVTVSMGGIDVTSTVYNNGQINITSVTGNIVITANAVVETIPCTGISLNNNTLTFASKTPQTLVATPTPSNTTDNTTWESDNTNIATVNNGVVTPVASGNCMITARCGNQTATCSVIVNLPTKVPITWQEGMKLNSTNGSESTDEKYSASDYIELLNNKTYTVHCNLVPSSVVGDVSCKFALYDSNKKFLAYATQTLAKADCPCDIELSELNSNAKYFRFRGYHSPTAKTAFLDSLSVSYV